MNDYDNAEVIYHEINAHVDLAGSKDEHDAYGLSTAGVMRDDITPKKGSLIIKKQDEKYTE